MCTCIKREVIKICNQFVTPALKVFLAWKKQKQKTKQKQNRKKGSFTPYSALTSLFQEQAESVHVCIFKLHIASCCYIYSCLMTPSQVWRL